MISKINIFCLVPVVLFLAACGEKDTGEEAELAAQDTAELEAEDTATLQQSGNQDLFLVALMGCRSKTGRRTLTPLMQV